MGSKDNWQVWVNVKWKPGTPASAWEGWKGHPKVKGAWSTMGDWDCMLWLDVTQPDEMESFVWKEVRGNQWVETTQTHWGKHL